MLLPIIAALCCVVSAGWLRQLGGGDDGQLSWIARETAGTATEGAQIGWTPKPTSAPRAQPETERVLDLLLKRETAGNWTNSVTCGWMSGVSCKFLYQISLLPIFFFLNLEEGINLRSIQLTLIQQAPGPVVRTQPVPPTRTTSLPAFLEPSPNSTPSAWIMLPTWLALVITMP